MEQQRALNALEPFLAIAKSATSPRAAVDVVVQATSAPNTYVFAELLESPNIQLLRQSPEHSGYLKLLEVFAWGTVHDYTQTLPKLNQQQTQKLQLLSLLPLLSYSSTPKTNTQSYAYLQQSLGLKSAEELESLVQTAIYASLVEGQLDPLHERVVVTSIAPLRDIAPGTVPQYIAKLQRWETQCGSVLQEIESNIATIKARALQKRKTQTKQSQTFEEELAKEDSTSAGTKRGDLMDLDDEDLARSAGAIAGSGNSSGAGSGSRGVKRNLKTMFSRHEKPVDGTDGAA